MLFFPNRNWSHDESRRSSSRASVSSSEGGGASFTPVKAPHPTFYHQRNKPKEVSPMRIGHSTIPRMRVPAVFKGNVIWLDLGNLRGKWGMICCLPPFDFGEAVFLNQYHRTVQKEGAGLVGMLPSADPMLDPSLPKTKALGIPLLADPLQRLHRTLGLSGRPSSNRCQSFIFDPRGFIRYHLVHRLNWRGMSFLVETLKHCQELYTQPSTPLTNDTITQKRRRSSAPTQARRTRLTLIPQQ